MGKTLPFQPMPSDIPVGMRAGGYRDKAMAFDEPLELVERAASDLPPGALDPPGFGEDYSANNGTVGLGQLLGGKDRFAALRVTGGLGYPRTDNVWMDSMFPTWEAQIPRYSELAWMYYGFPIDGNAADMDDQLDHFLNRPKSWEHRIPLIDYEMYGPRSAISCTPGGVKAYLRGICRELQNRWVGIYCGWTWWNAPPYTGDASEIQKIAGEFGCKVFFFNAWYKSMADIAHPVEYYRSNVRTAEYWHKIGGQIPDFCQFGIGQKNQDQDACRREMDWLMNLTEKIAA